MKYQKYHFILKLDHNYFSDIFTTADNPICLHNTLTDNESCITKTCCGGTRHQHTSCELKTSQKTLVLGVYYKYKRTKSTY